MWGQFFLQNLHFAINLIAAFVFIAIFWLYFDAWRARKDLRGFIRCFGFILVSLSFLANATIVESHVIHSSFSQERSILVLQLLKCVGFILIAISVHLDPILPKPDTSEHLSSKLRSIIVPPLVLPLIIFIQFLLPATIAVLYYRRATKGLERHLKKVAWGFILFSIYEFLESLQLLRNTTNPTLYNLVAPFGGIWILQHIVLVAMLVVLGVWVFSYLLKQIQTQLFIIFATAVAFIFILVTVAFTGFLLRTIQKESLAQLETDSKVLNLSIQSLKETMSSDAEFLAQNSFVQESIANRSRHSLADFSEKFLLTKHASSLILIDANGKVLAHGEDKDRFGESLSEDPVVKRLLAGNQVSTVSVREGVVSPEVHALSGAVIKNNNVVIGAVVISRRIDNAFLDGLKNATGLDVSVYGNNVLAATTLMNGSKTRSVGISESAKKVTISVLEKGENFTGSTSIQNVPYFGTYSPLNDVDGHPAGMLFVGKKQIIMLQTASNAVAYTFILSVITLLLLLGPIYMTSRYISRQFR